MKKTFTTLFALSILVPAAEAIAQTGTPPSTTQQKPTTTQQQPTTKPQQPSTTQQQPGTHDHSRMTAGDERMKEDMERAALETDMEDGELAAKIHAIHQHEIEMATLASTQGSSKAVKDYAKQLLSDHEKADKKLTDLATKKQWTLTSANPMAAHKEAKKEEKKNELTSLTGTAFDKKFLMMMHKGHDKAIMTLNAQAFTQPTDDDLKKMIKAELTTMEKHRKKAIELLQKQTPMQAAG
jgi:putative membrane protein